MNAFSLDVCR